MDVHKIFTETVCQPLYVSLLWISVWRWASNRNICIERQLWVGVWGVQSSRFIGTGLGHPLVSARTPLCLAHPRVHSTENVPCNGTCEPSYSLHFTPTLAASLAEASTTDHTPLSGRFIYNAPCDYDLLQGSTFITRFLTKVFR